MQTQPSAGCDPRIQKWAAGHRKSITVKDFALSLDGAQVGGELMNIFRETPEFGRSLSVRLAPFLDESAEGNQVLIGGGGEAIVFYDEKTQHVTKLFAPPCKALFGWIVTMENGKPVGIRPGEMDEALLRFSWMEELFPSGLEIEAIGAQSEFLLLKQPFISGQHPTTEVLHQWMRGQGWKPFRAESQTHVIRDLTWQRGEWFATDVRPENALVADSDRELRAIDFIVQN